MTPFSFNHQLQNKATTLTQLTLHPNTSPVHRHNLFTQAQPDTSTRRLGCKEWNEDSIHHLGQDATTIVRHRELEDMLLFLISRFYYHFGVR